MCALETTYVLSDEAYRDLEEAVGAENVSREPGVLDGYAWQPTNNDHPTERWVKRPVAVALPASTEEVQAVVRACNKHGLRFKAFSTGWGVWCGPTYDNVVQVDLRRMNRILEIDAANSAAHVQAGVVTADLQAE
ncbi:MAG: FAD-binding oxidoreductase, partial [Candidatus Geothermincolales bacterium]